MAIPIATPMPNAVQVAGNPAPIAQAEDAPIQLSLTRSQIESVVGLLDTLKAALMGATAQAAPAMGTDEADLNDFAAQLSAQGNRRM